jgi:hypothetical protein
MTPGQIEVAARRLMNAESSQFWSSAEIIEDYLYMTILDLVNGGYHIENRYTQTTVASQEEYTKPSRAIAIKRVIYDGKKLKPISMREIDSMVIDTNTTTTGTSEFYWEFDDVIGLYRVPDSAKTLEMWTYDEPSRPSSTSTLEIRSNYHHHLIIGVVYYMCLKELGHPNTLLYERKWEQSKFKIIGEEKKRKQRDGMRVVLREEDVPNTIIGMN